MNKANPINEEYFFEGGMIITQTDLKGITTFVNRKFCEVSGYSVDEVINQNQNIIRHPDMPRAIFEKMWSTIESGQSWNGVLKNLRKDGLFYWVSVEILPILDDNQNTSGYISVKKVPSRKDIDDNEEIYNKMLKAQ